MDAAERNVVVPASPEEAWEAITDPDQLGEWLGDDAEIDLRPGGDLTIRVEEGERNGFVEEVDEPRRLVFWWTAGEEESSRVEIDLEPAVDGTRVRVVESRPLRELERLGASQPELCATV